MSKSSKPTRQNVKVVARIRPTNQKEINMGGVTCVKYTNDTIEVTDQGPNKFNLDRIFGPDSTQVEVFEETAVPLVQDVLAGYNATIFAYGQTGTGKTHTMEGDITSDTEKGIIPRAVQALFDGVSQADESIEFTFKVTYVEIYLERIRDLMDEHHLKNNLAIREDKIKGVYIAGVTEVYVASADELLQIMHVGASNRAVAATGMNEGSSRSHSVFTIQVSQRDINTNAAKSGKLVLVDLAGSEMVRKTNASGQQLEEAKMINKSLSALGQVINALTDGKATHVPYRDSKLTRVLQDSLGGNSKTVLVVAISPSSFNAPESVSTLRFGARAKSIENKVTVNQTRSVEELEALLVRAEKAIDAQTAHIIALSTQLQMLQEVGGGGAGGGVSHHAVAVAAPPGASLDEEALAAQGKIIVGAAQYEAEMNALRQLQDTVLSLTQELDDEKQDSQRKESELTQITALLKEKERLIQEAVTMVDEVKRSNDGLRERSEHLLREKIEAVGELQSLKSAQGEAVDKVKYDLMELEVRLNTLEAENTQLRDEIAELGGDSTNAGRSKKKVISSASANDEDDDTQFALKKITRRSYEPNAEVDPARALSNNERKSLLEQYGEQFASVCMRFGVDEQAAAELFAVMDGYAEAQERSFGVAEDKFSADQKVATRRLKELEDQRSRLAADLQSRIDAVFELQSKMDSLSRMNGRQVADALSERDGLKQRALQTRLEQLVAVHRQLLKRYATLELECGELKKKTALRDERIKQLEGNSKTLVGSIRHQAEKHVAELATLKESIQVLRGEYEYRLEELKRFGDDSAASPASKGNIKVVVKPKALRGGGGTSRSFYGESPRAMAAMLEGGNPESSYFFSGPSHAPATPGSSGAPPPYPASPSSFDMSRVMGMK